MKVCYIDEAGCTGRLPSANSNIQPVLVITAVIFDYVELGPVTQEYINLKRRFFPNQCGSDYLGSILVEVKGSSLRSQITQSARNARRHAFGYLDGVLKLCEAHGVRLVGRAWIKGIAKPFKGTSVYTYSVQTIYSAFQNFLEQQNDYGVVIADSRWHALNTGVAHSIFTQKFRRIGDQFDRILELPAFSHSDNHAGLQIADLIGSALLFPMAVQTYCAGHITSVHNRPKNQLIKDRYASTLRFLQHRYQDATAKWRGGITVSDSIGQQNGAKLFC